MSEAPRLYLDTNIFILAFENIGARSDHAWWVMDAIDKGEVIGVTSEITLAETLVKPFEFGDDELAASYQTVLTSSPVMDVRPVLREILIGAATIRARRPSVKLPDAIHIATANAAGCTFFLSNDERLYMPEGIRRIPLTPFTLDDVKAAWN